MDVIPTSNFAARCYAARSQMNSYPRRLVTSSIAIFLCVALASCAGTSSSSNSPGPPPPVAELSAADVQSIVQAAASAVNVPYVVAVTNREGDILAVYQKGNHKNAIA